MAKRDYREFTNGCCHISCIVALYTIFVFEYFFFYLKLYNIQYTIQHDFELLLYTETYLNVVK